MSTQKYDSSFLNIGSITNDISTTPIINSMYKTLTSVRGEGTAEVFIYANIYSDVWDLICDDAGNPYKLVFTEQTTGGQYIPLNPQFFYGISKVKLVLDTGSLDNVCYIARMV